MKLKRNLHLHQLNKRWEHISDLHKQALHKGLNVDIFLIEKLRRDAITLQKMFEFECNGCTRDKMAHETWAQYDLIRDEQMKWVEKRQNAIIKRIKRRCEENHLLFYIQGDPRGCSLYIGTNDESNYSTQGVAIY